MLMLFAMRREIPLFTAVSTTCSLLESDAARKAGRKVEV